VEVTFPYFVDDMPPGCDVNEVRVLPTTARLRVSGKGEMAAHLPGGDCHARFSGSPFRTEQAFTIIGGSGMYEGASGTGTLSDVSFGPPLPAQATTLIRDGERHLEIAQLESEVCPVDHRDCEASLVAQLAQ
jgi:hypothetical protein